MTFCEDIEGRGYLHKAVIYFVTCIFEQLCSYEEKTLAVF